MSTNSKIIKFYWSLINQYPFLAITMVISDILAMITFRIIPPIYATDIIRRLSSGDYIAGDFWNSFKSEIILFSVSLFLGGVVFKRLELWMRFLLEINIEQNIKSMMHAKYLDLDIKFHADNFGGSLTSRSGKLVASYVRFVDSVLHPTVQALTSILAILIVVSNKAPVLLVIFLVICSLFIITALKLSPWVSRIFIEKAKADNRDTGLLADSITNIINVKSYANSEYEKRIYKNSTDKSKHLLKKAGSAVLVRDTLFSTITTMISVATILVAVIAIVEQNANVAIAFLLLAYSNTLVDQLFYFGTTTISSFDRCIGDAQDGIETLLQEVRVKDTGNIKNLKIEKGSIDFSNVTFSHNDSEDDAIFDNFNLEIKNGEKIGIVGPSGGGKTTLTKLIMRFMDLDKGSIKIDGQSISEIKQEELRKYIAYVPQEPVMFHRSIAENIRYGKLDATPIEIKKIAKMAHADSFIENLEKGYDTLVGERGVKLSGGQRQRIAIARAMLKNAPILVLDEATSALDSESEVLIQDALKKLMKNKTAIVIAHRLSTIQNMDRIIVLDDGKIVEDGSHKQLLAQGGTYSKLWAHQSGGFLED